MILEATLGAFCHLRDLPRHPVSPVILTPNTALPIAGNVGSHHWLSLTGCPWKPLTSLGLPLRVCKMNTALLSFLAALILGF